MLSKELTSFLLVDFLRLPLPTLEPDLFLSLRLEDDLIIGILGTSEFLNLIFDRDLLVSSFLEAFNFLQSCFCNCLELALMSIW